MHGFTARSHSGGELLLHSCHSLLPSVSVHPSVCISVAPTWRISLKFVNGDFCESLLEIPNLSSISKSGCRALSKKFKYVRLLPAT